MAKTKRVSMTLPIDLVDSLDFVSNRLQVSRSSLISEILITNISPIREIIQQVSPETDAKDGSTSLSRDPAKVREYLDSLSEAIQTSSSDFDISKNELIASMEGLKNEH